MEAHQVSDEESKAGRGRSQVGCNPHSAIRLLIGKVMNLLVIDCQRFGLLASQIWNLSDSFLLSTNHTFGRL